MDGDKYWSSSTKLPSTKKKYFKSFGRVRQSCQKQIIDPETHPGAILWLFTPRPPFKGSINRDFIFTAALLGTFWQELTRVTKPLRQDFHNGDDGEKNKMFILWLPPGRGLAQFSIIWSLVWFIGGGGGALSWVLKLHYLRHRNTWTGFFWRWHFLPQSKNAHYQIWQQYHLIKKKGRNQLKTGFGQKGLKSFWLTHRTPL